MSEKSVPNPSHLPEELQPCEHLTTLVSRRSDDSLKGPAKWYIDLHVMTCPHCRAALEGLRALNDQIAHLTQASENSELHLDSAEWKQVESGWGNGASSY